MKCRNKGWSFCTVLLVLLGILLIFQSCGCGCGCGGKAKKEGKGYRIGVDPNWYPENFQKMEPYVFGYTEEILIEISKEMNVEFQRIEANWEDLLEGLKKSRFDGIFSSLPPYDFRKEIFSFSNLFLITAPVLVVQKEANYQDLSDLAKKSVGILENSQDDLLLQKYQDMLIRSYVSYGKALNALSEGKIAGCVLPYVFAIGYLEGVYFDKLKIVGNPLTDEGLRLITLKGESVKLLSIFNEGLERLKKKGILDQIAKKWNLHKMALSTDSEKGLSQPSKSQEIEE